MPAKPTLGHRVAETRKACGISKSQLAKQLKVSPTAVWNWEENGVTPRPAMVGAIAKALRVTEAFLLTGAALPAPKRTAADIIAAAAVEIADLNGVPISRVQIDWRIN